MISRSIQVNVLLLRCNPPLPRDAKGQRFSPNLTCFPIPFWCDGRGKLAGSVRPLYASTRHKKNTPTPWRLRDLLTRRLTVNTSELPIYPFENLPIRGDALEALSWDYAWNTLLCVGICRYVWVYIYIGVRFCLCAVGAPTESSKGGSTYIDEYRVSTPRGFGCFDAFLVF